MAVSGLLGCGEYEAYIVPRGGGNGEIVAVLEWNELSWGRRLDDTSQASATVDSDCCDLLQIVRPWRHELAIYRDGELVWVGPVINPSAPVASDHQQWRVEARDLSAWWDHRRIHSDHVYDTPTDLATMFQDFADDAMSVDNSPGLVVVTTPCGVQGTRTILGTQHQMAGLELRDLANIGIDWTLIVREVMAGGAIVPTAPLDVFLDEHFTQPPAANLDGTSQANNWVIRGAGGGTAGDTIYGESSDAAAAVLDGILESVDTVTTIESNEAALGAAQTRVALTAAVVGAENAPLAPSAPFPITVLVPGALCPLALQETCIPIFGSYRLQGIDVVANGQDGTETVTPIFQPEGTT
jgi:hypothetical protein